MKIIKISTPAKINLGLQVLNKRKDAFHNISTIFVPISIYDHLELSLSDKFSLNSQPELNFPINDNIITKAVKKFREFYSINDNVSLSLKKNIPMGAGLGGGSSDGAAALLGMQRLFKVKYNYHELFTMALSLGSDVPFFLKKGFASGKSRGEILRYHHFELPYKVIIVYPKINISTKWAYDTMNRSDAEIVAKDFVQALKQSKYDISILKNELVNDFELVIFEKYPEIADIKSKLYSFGAVYSQMSGSGSAVFGLFQSEEKALKAKAHFSLYDSYLLNILSL